MFSYYIDPEFYRPESLLATDPSRTACFSGHRPDKFPFDVNDRICFGVFLKRLNAELLKAVDRGFDTFMTGMQRGVDIWAGILVMGMKRKGCKVSLIGVSPFRSEIDSRRNQDYSDYVFIRDHCDEFIVLAEKYSGNVFHNRNSYMVEHSGLVIAALSDPKSGTGNTLRDAKQRGVETAVVDLNLIARQFAR